MPQVGQVTRRSFLRGTAAAGAAVLTARNHARAAGASGRLNVGVIGCGTIATGEHLPALLRLRDQDNIEIMAVCDVYQTRAQEYLARCKAGGANPKPTLDYREILANRDIDYVLIATPEHSHAKITLDALRAGKHVYCEKPLTHTIEESQEVVSLAKKTGLKLQTGVQGMSDDSYESACEAILAGKLGPVVEAQIDYVRNYKQEGLFRKGIPDNQPKPADLDWQAWLEPATPHAWDPHRYHEWRCYRDYSGGIATDLFVHRITRILKACRLSYPEHVVGMGGIYMWPDGRDLPDNMEMLAEYPAVEGVTPGMTLRVLGTMANDFRSDHCIRGHKATLIFRGDGWDILAETKGKPVVASHKRTGAEDVFLHHRNHHAAIRDNVPLKCPPELGLYGVVAVRMANLSWFERKLMKWDATKQAAVPA